MPSQFDELIAALAEVQARRPGPPPPSMAKAMPAPRPPAPSKPPVNMPALARRIAGIGASIRAANKATDDKRKKAEFFKALSAAHAQLGRAITAGKIDADSAILIEAKLHRLAEDGMRAAASAESRR